MTWHATCANNMSVRPASRTQCAELISLPHKGTSDWIGAFAVTAGIGIEKKLAEFDAAHDDYHAIMLKVASPTDFAEACAEWLHARSAYATTGATPADEDTR
jgi:5-methyltetrahydrofolate--homocysteine methyltransferase